MRSLCPLNSATCELRTKTTDNWLNIFNIFNQCTDKKKKYQNTRRYIIFWRGQYSDGCYWILEHRLCRLYCTTRILCHLCCYKVQSGIEIETRIQTCTVAVVWVIYNVKKTYNNNERKKYVIKTRWYRTSAIIYVTYWWGLR
jgi:hypothetical protein